MGADSPSVRAVIYTRVSTRDQSLEGQLGQCRAFVAARGWSTVRVIRDHGVSGTTWERPGLAELQLLIDDGAVDVVVVQAIDRIARSAVRLLLYIDDCQKAGIAFVSVREGLDTSTDAGKLVAGFLALLADFERRQMLERQAHGIRRSVGAGTHGRPRRFVDLEAARALLAAGHSKTAIAKALGVSRTTLRRHLNGQLKRGPRALEES